MQLFTQFVFSLRVFPFFSQRILHGTCMYCMTFIRMFYVWFQLTCTWHIDATTQSENGIDEKSSLWLYAACLIHESTYVCDAPGNDNRERAFVRSLRYIHYEHWYELKNRTLHAQTIGFDSLIYFDQHHHRCCCLRTANNSSSASRSTSADIWRSAATLLWFYLFISSNYFLC